MDTRHRDAGVNPAAPGTNWIAGQTSPWHGETPSSILACTTTMVRAAARGLSGNGASRRGSTPRLVRATPCLTSGSPHLGYRRPILWNIRHQGPRAPFIRSFFDAAVSTARRAAPCEQRETSHGQRPATAVNHREVQSKRSELQLTRRELQLNHRELPRGQGSGCRAGAAGGNRGGIISPNTH